MTSLTDLLPEILNLILVMVATSTDGARTLARLGSTCKSLKGETKMPDLLKLVNFKGLTFTVNDFMMHHHAEDLLCLSARAGNQAAHVILGKALLVNDPWFWNLILKDYQQAFFGFIAASEALHHHSLVRTFILHASSKDICTMCSQLLKYVFAHVGYTAARDHGLINGIFNMCTFEAGRLVLYNVGSTGTVYNLEVRAEPPYEPTLRRIVIIAYDKLFPMPSD